MIVPIRLARVDVAVNYFHSVVESEDLRSVEPAAVASVAGAGYVEERTADDRRCGGGRLRFGNTHRTRSTARTNHI